MEYVDMLLFMGSAMKVLVVLYKNTKDTQTENALVLESSIEFFNIVAEDLSPESVRQLNGDRNMEK